MTEDLLQEVQPPVEASPLPPPTRYRLTVLTPTLAGDGQKLSPIDYMVWKDQVNVLNQRRIFRLLARGPRIESYLGQLRKSEKLDFASWGGYAQNYALRRIAFDDPASAEVYDRAPAELCSIPTFASNLDGIYLPASVLKGSSVTPSTRAIWYSAGSRTSRTFMPSCGSSSARFMSCTVTSSGFIAGFGAAGERPQNIS